MQRINTPDGNWHAGDPSQGIKGTVVTQPYMQTVQEELAAVPESVGMKLDPTDTDALYAIAAGRARGSPFGLAAGPPPSKRQVLRI